MGIFSFFSVSERTVSALENSRFECCVCGTVINKVCLFNLFTGIPGTFHSCKTGEAFSFLFVWFSTSCQSCLREERAISWRLLETGAALYIYKSKCMPLCLQLLFMRAESAHKSSQSPASHLYRDSRGGHCQSQDVMLALYFKHVMLPRFCWLSLVCCGTDPPVQNNHQQSTQHGDIALRTMDSSHPTPMLLDTHHHHHFSEADTRPWLHLLDRQQAKACPKQRLHFPHSFCPVKLPLPSCCCSYVWLKCVLSRSSKLILQEKTMGARGKAQADLMQALSGDGGNMSFPCTSFCLSSPERPGWETLGFAAPKEQV